MEFVEVSELVWMIEDIEKGRGKRAARWHLLVSSILLRMVLKFEAVQALDGWNADGARWLDCR